MKRNNKKGFTIVELVIVIAVIAILSAVLIPTFSGLVDKAEASARDQEIRNALTNQLVKNNGVLAQTEFVYAEIEGDETANDTVDGYVYTYSGTAFEKDVDEVDIKVTIDGETRTYSYVIGEGNTAVTWNLTQAQDAENHNIPNIWIATKAPAA